MPEIAFESLLAGLPPEPERVLGQVQALLKTNQRKVVVLDDDPTGTQTVDGICVLTEWPISALQVELSSHRPGFFLLTNSRSLAPEAARTLGRQIGANLSAAAQAAGVEIAVISRSDSTLRGHFPAEVEALTDGLETRFDGWILAPYFREGGRYTIGDIHYVVSGGSALPAGETEFARDPAFGYTASNLREWVTEKTAGRIPPETVEALSIQDLRGGNALEKLLKLHNGQVCIVNAATDMDMELAVLALLQAEVQGKHMLYRTASSFVRVRLGLYPRSLLSPDELADSARKTGGLVVVGSFVPKTTMQLESLRASRSFVELELDVYALLDRNQRPALMEETIAHVNDSLARGQDVLLFTSRQLITGSDGRASLDLGKTISQSLVDVILGLNLRPRYLIAKGGITASDIATRGLGVRKALVRGQILPGVPVWQLGAESRFPGMDYVIFPGNVGSSSALSEAVGKFDARETTC